MVLRWLRCGCQGAHCHRGNHPVIEGTIVSLPGPFDSTPCRHVMRLESLGKVGRSNVKANRPDFHCMIIIPPFPPQWVSTWIYKKDAPLCMQQLATHLPTSVGYSCSYFGILAWTGFRGYLCSWSCLMKQMIYISNFMSNRSTRSLASSKLSIRISSLKCGIW